MGKILRTLSAVVLDQGEDALAERYLLESLSLVRELDDVWNVATCLGMLGDIDYQRGHWDEAVARHREALAIWRERGFEGGMSEPVPSRRYRPSARRQRGCHPLPRRGLGHLAKLGGALAGQRAPRSRPGLAGALLRSSLGWGARAKGDLEAAQALIDESRELRKAIGDTPGAHLCSAELVALGGANGQNGSPPSGSSS